MLRPLVSIVPLSVHVRPSGVLPFSVSQRSNMATTEMTVTIHPNDTGNPPVSVKDPRRRTAMKQSQNDVKVIARGMLVLEGWAGRTKTPVEIIGMTPKRYRIRAVTRTRLGGRNRWLDVGHTALVPRHAVSDVQPLQ
jgi:hypothetical protein